MATCLNEASVKLFGEYFNRLLPELVSQDMTYSDLLQKVYDRALSDFKGKGVVSETISDDEVVMHHMLILPAVTAKYLASNPSISFPELSQTANQFQANVFNSVNSKTPEKELNKLLDDYASIVSEGEVYIYPNSKDVDQSKVVPAFSARKQRLSTTRLKDFTIKDTKRGVVSNIDNPVYAYHIALAQTIQRTSNPQGYKFKLVTIGTLRKMEGVDEGIKNRDLYGKNDTPVMVVVNAKGEIVKFDENGIEDVNGKISPFLINTHPTHLGLTGNRDGINPKTNLANRANALYDNYRKFYPKEEAKKLAKEQALMEANAYLNNITELIKKAETENVFLDFDLDNSSQGVIEFNDIAPTNLKDVDLTEPGYSLTSSEDVFKSRRPLLNIPGSNSPVRVQNKPLDSLSDKQIDVIIQLLTNNNLKVDAQNKITQEERLSLLSAYIQISDTAHNQIKISFDKKGKGEVTKIVLNGVPFTISLSSISEAKANENIENFTKAFKSYVKEFIPIEYSGQAPNNYDMPKSLSEVDKNLQGVVYEEVPGKRMKALKPEISFALMRAVDLSESLNIPVDVVDNVIQSKETTYADHIQEHGYVTVIPNAEGKIKGSSPYLSFSLGSQPAQEAESYTAGDELLMSIDEANKASEKVDQRDEAAAEKWFAESGWSNTNLNLVLSKEVHKNGPSVLATFFKNTITLYKGTTKTAIYHEVFHAYADGILTPAEKSAMLNEVRADFKGTSFNVTVYGVNKTVSFDKATDLEIEEFLAEEFRAFAINKSRYNSKPKSSVAQFFEKLLDFIKRFVGAKTSIADVTILGNNSAKIQALFNDIYEGNFEYAKFNPPITSEEKLMSYQLVDSPSPLTMSEQDVLTAITSMKGLMALFTERVVSTTNDPQLNSKLSKLMVQLSLLNKNNPAQAESHKSISDEISKLRSFSTKGAGSFRLENNTELLTDAIEFMYNKLESSKDNPNISFEGKQLLTKILSNFGDISLPLNEYYKKNDTLLGLFLNKHTTISLDSIIPLDEVDIESARLESEVSDEEVLGNDLDFGKQGNELDITETVDAKTKELLSTLFEHDRDGEGSLQLNMLKLPELVPFKRALVKVLLITDGLTNREHAYNALLEKAKTDKIIEQLVNRLGDIRESIDFSEQKQWNSFWASVNKATIRLRTLNLEKEENEEDGTASVISKSGKSKLDVFQITSSWNYNFSTKDDFLKIAKVGQLETKVLDVKKLLDKYNKLVYSVETPSKAYGSVLYYEEHVTNLTKSTPIALWKVDPAQLLRDIGIEIPSNNETNNMLRSGKGEIDSFFFPELIKNLEAHRDNEGMIANSNGLVTLKDVFSSFNVVTQVNNRNDFGQPYSDLTGYLDRLAAYAFEYNTQYINFMSWTPEGEKMSEKSFHSTVTVQISHINQAKHIDELISIPGFEHLDYRINPAIAGNKTFVQMFNLDSDKPGVRGSRNEKFSLTFENIAGSKVTYKNQEQGVKSIHSDPKTKFATEFYHTLLGRPEILRSEAKTSSYSYFGPIQKPGENTLRDALYINNVEASRIFKDGYEKLEGREGLLLYNEFSSYIEAELVRITRIEKLKARAKKETIEFDPKFLERGSDFTIFDIMLTAETQTELKAFALSESFSMNSTISEELKKKIESELVSYFLKRSNELFNDYHPTFLLSDNVLEEFSLEGESDIQTKKRLFNMVSVNSALNYLNYTSMFLGDAAIYDIAGESFHKRIAGAVSTGTLFISDDSWYNFINSANYEKDGFAKKHFENLSPERKQELESKGRKSYFNRGAYAGYLNTGIMKEAKSKSINIEQYTSVLGINNSDKYMDMEEADGTAFISFDAYRLLAESSQEWSKEQEAMYQKMLKGEYINPLELKGSFPIRKYQYQGAVSSKHSKDIGLVPVAFHKYSLVPLIPNVIKDKPLQELHEKMMEQGIDYIGFESISKLSTIKKIDSNGAIDNVIYDVENGRTITDEDIVVNKIHVKHLKSQVHISEGFKGKITLFSQMRKMVYLGSFSNGVPVDFKVGEKNSAKKLKAYEKLIDNYKSGKATLADVKKESPLAEWSLRYEETTKRFQDVLKKQLLEDLGLVEGLDAKGNKTYSGSTDKMLDYIKKELESKNLLPEEVNGLIDPVTQEMIADLSLSTNSSKIEEILVGLVDKRLRAIKVKGEGFIQQSGAMMESGMSLTEPTAEDLMAYGTNGLRTYYGLKEDGTVATDKDSIKYIQAMDVKIALQGDFKELFYTKFNDEAIAVYEVFESEDGRKTRRLNFDESLKRLNEAIKNKEYFEKHKDLLTLTGPRIPTQAFSSLEAAYVREFLPPMADKTIILPAEIVAKAGSDYDIDKLYLMMPHIARYGESVELVKYNNTGRSNVELEALLEDINLEKEQIALELQELYLANEKLASEFTDLESNVDLTEINSEIAAYSEAIAENKKLKDDAKSKYEMVYTRKGEFSSISGELRRENLDAIIAYQQMVDSAIRTNQEELNIKVKEKHQMIMDAYSESFSETSAETPYDFRQAEFAKNQAKIDALKEEIDENRLEYHGIRREIHGNGSKGLENELLSLFHERIIQPSAGTLKSLVEPNATDFFQNGKDGIADQFEKLLSKNRAYNKKGKGVNSEHKGSGLAGSTAFDLNFNLIKHQENSAGLDALGIAAVTSTFYAMFTKMGAHMVGLSVAEQASFDKALETFKDFNKAAPVDQKVAMETLNKFSGNIIKLKHNKTENNEISISSINNVDGVNISDIIGQLINGYVDVAKKPWIFNVQGGVENAGNLLYLIMAGVSVEDAVKMSSLSFVLEYNNLKAEMSGAFASMDKEFGSSPIRSKSKVKADARKKMFDKHSELIKNGMKRTYDVNDYKVLGNISPEISSSTLDGFIKSPGSFDEFLAFAHFLQIEDAANDITDFTMASKFDTQKIKNISDADARQTQIKNNLNSPSLFPSKFYDAFNSTIVGLFNNDEFILDVLSKHFGLRNNLSVIRMAGLVKRSEQLAGKDYSSIRKLYKDTFISYLFQNSLFQEDHYNGYDLTVDTSLDTLLDINDVMGTVKYNPQHIQRRIDELSSDFGSSLNKFFPTDQHFIRFEIEYRKFNSEVLDMEKNEMLDNYYYLANGSYKKNFIYVRGFTKIVAAFYKSNNNVAMFDNNLGYAKILENILVKHPEVKESYSLLKDLDFSFDKETKKLNLFLPDSSNPDLMRVYRENYKMLMNSPYPEIREFFTKMQTYAFLQTGMERNSKTDLVRLVPEQNLFADIINDNTTGINANGRLLAELDRASDQLRQGVSIEDIDAPTLRRFNEFYATLTESPMIHKRNRGINLIDNTLTKSEEFDVEKAEDEIAGSKNALSITKSEKSRYFKNSFFVHETLAQRSNKAIGSSFEGVNTELDLAKNYAEHIANNYPKTLAGEKVTFTEKDSVWIFGTSNSKAVRGSNSEEVFNEKLKVNFNKYYKAHIDKAISKGVTTFNVGNFNGIELMSREYLEGKGFYSIPRYTKAGKYFEMVKIEGYQDKAGELVKVGNVKFMVGKGPASAQTFNMEMLLDSDLAKEINTLDEKEILEGIAESRVQADINSKLIALKTPGNKSFDEAKRNKFIEQLILSNGHPIVVSDSFSTLYNALVEKYLMDARTKFVNKEVDKARKYNTLTKTASGNVSIFPTNVMAKADGKPGLDYNAMFNYANEKGGLYPLRTFQKNHFGNPFSEKFDTSKQGIVLKFDTVAEAVKAYEEWLTTEKYDKQFPELMERKNWIMSEVLSGKHKGKSIFYYTERNQSTHANVLDNLINSNKPLTEKDVAGIEPTC